MLHDLVLKNRSYRRFYEDVAIDRETLIELVDMARNTPSAANKQPIRYKIVNDKAGCDKIFPNIGWAGYLKDWPGPEEGERPAAYIIMAVSADANATIDEGIAGQTILLGAVEKGLGGCFLGNIKKDRIAECISLPANMKIDYVIALGKPKETVVLEDIKDDDIKYYRDEEGVHHVPKRTLEQVLL
ncbi:MAG: nitroreductase family protein [Lachnospiraceae bacterium]|nr:nitroreductase family protein [Lachnospiraceae bacterium]